MPRKSKEKIELDENLENANAEKKVSKKTITKKESTEKKAVSKKAGTKKATTKSATKKSTSVEKPKKEVTSKSTSAKKSSKTTKQLSKTEKKDLAQEANTSNSLKEPKKKAKNETKTTTPKPEDKLISETKSSSKSSKSTPKTSAPKVSAKTTKTQKSTSKSKTTSKSTKTTSSSKTRTSKKSVEIIEYYDLPYRYNKTIIKLLAQTPNSLFVYWDISDEDRNNFVLQYGENFFNETKPVLLVHNETMNYTFEVEINDFANSWYLKVNDADCVYKIELGRKYFNKPLNLTSDYIYITASNDLEAPNDHILFNNLVSVYFKNVKTNQKVEKKISDIATLKNIGKIYNIYDLYKKIYSEENINNFDLNNPSSGLSSSSFKI